MGTISDLFDFTQKFLGLFGVEIDAFIWCTRAVVVEAECSRGLPPINSQVAGGGGDAAGGGGDAAPHLSHSHSETRFIVIRLDYTSEEGEIQWENCWRKTG